jgi:hypothetical protein
MICRHPVCFAVKFILFFFYALSGGLIIRFIIFIRMMIYNTKIIAPAAISTPPRMGFKSIVSSKKITEKIITKTTLNLSIGATFDTLPVSSALK